MTQISDCSRISSVSLPFCGVPEEILFNCIVKNLDVRVWKVFSECSKLCNELANQNDCKAIKIKNEVCALQIHTFRPQYTVFEELSSHLSLLNNPSNILLQDIANYIGPQFCKLPIYDLHEFSLEDDTILQNLTSEDVPKPLMRGLDKNKHPFLLIKENERCSILYQGPNDDSFFLSYKYDEGFVRYTNRRRRLSVNKIRDISFTNIRTFDELDQIKSKLSLGR